MQACSHLAPNVNEHRRIDRAITHRLGVQPMAILPGRQYNVPERHAGHVARGVPSRKVTCRPLTSDRFTSFGIRLRWSGVPRKLVRTRELRRWPFWPTPRPVYFPSRALVGFIRDHWTVLRPPFALSTLASMGAFGHGDLNGLDLSWISDEGTL